MTCPNCSCPVKTHPRNDCVLAAFVGILRDRGNLSEEKLRAIHCKADMHVFWDDLGPILDRLEEGFYTSGN